MKPSRDPGELFLPFVAVLVCLPVVLAPLAGVDVDRLQAQVASVFVALVVLVTLALVKPRR